MSKSAYRIEKKVFEGRVWSSHFSKATFNFSHDSDVRDFLVARAVIDNLNEDGGNFTIHVDSLKELIDEAEKNEIVVSTEIISRIKDDFHYVTTLGILALEYTVF